MTDVNPQLQALFNGHGIITIPLEHKFLLLTRQLALVKSLVNKQDFPNGISSRLDISVAVKDRTIVECFGDIGDTAEIALVNNLQNFAQNSLHIIIGALQGVQEHEQFDVEQWEANRHTWKVYCGNYGIKSVGIQRPHIPSELFNRIEQIIRKLPLSQEYHWFRFFFSCNNVRISAAEFLYDNEVFGEAVQELMELDWQLTAEFYSIRLFLILRRLD
jgi:hypothetical protein